MDLRPELPPLPDAMQRLPVGDRGYPIPWFVAELEDGTRDFRIMDPEKRERARRENRCWVCGGRMGRFKAYVIGPMCAVNRTSAEPPSHVDCAVFSAIACPFLTRPHARRREAGLPEDRDLQKDSPGIALERNPGVTLVWVVEGKLRTFSDRRGGYLFNIGEPVRVHAYAEGRPAFDDEIDRSIETGLPALRELAEAEGETAVAELEKLCDRARKLLAARE